jgi:hypothetical protein
LANLDADDVKPVADELAALVAQFMDPSERISQLETPDPSREYTAAEVHASYAEYRALCRLVDCRDATTRMLDPHVGAALVVSAISDNKTDGRKIDASVLIDEIRRRATHIAKGNALAIRELMAAQVVVANQVALATIASVSGTRDKVRRALIAKAGVNMLNTSQRMLERFARLDQALPTQVVNVAHTQQVVVQESNKLNGKAHKRLAPGKASEVLARNSRLQDVGSLHRPDH